MPENVGSVCSMSSETQETVTNKRLTFILDGILARIADLFTESHDSVTSLPRTNQAHKRTQKMKSGRRH